MIASRNRELLKMSETNGIAGIKILKIYHKIEKTTRQIQNMYTINLSSAKNQ